MEQECIEKGSHNDMERPHVCKPSINATEHLPFGRHGALTYKEASGCDRNPAGR